MIDYIIGQIKQFDIYCLFKLSIRYPISQQQIFSLPQRIKNSNAKKIIIEVYEVSQTYQVQSQLSKQCFRAYISILIMLINIIFIMSNSLNAGQKLNGLCIKSNDFNKLAEIVTNMDSSQPLKNLPFLTQSLKQASGFIKNRYQKRDFKCLNKILQNQLGSFRQLQQQAQSLSIDLTTIHQKNNRKEKRIRKLQQEKQELEECSNLMTEYVHRKQFDYTIKGLSKANNQVQIKTQMNKNMTKKPKKEDFDLHFSNVQFGGEYIPQQGDSNILKKFKSYEYKKDIVEESQIYSQLKIGQQVQQRFVNRPNNNHPQEQKGIKIVRPSLVKEFVSNYNPQAEKEALHPLPSMLQSKLSLISLPSSLQSNIPQPKTANKKISS